ncbi:hypothetical protein D5086_028028 [Populus alba]|uniref:Uncharacterized protein n=1 Tax=Populus alba TaxID=43335 RepID=A0ACC4AWZ5_POPAL
MRKPCCDKQHTNKGAWSKQEDQKLIDYIQKHGEGCWRSLPQAAGGLRAEISSAARSKSQANDPETFVAVSDSNGGKPEPSNKSSSGINLDLTLSIPSKKTGVKR